MDLRFPAALIEVDRALHALHRRYAYSRHLNPTNGREAYEAFVRGAPVRFSYQPADWADEALGQLGQLRPPLDHPFGPILERSVQLSALFIRALRDRSAESFDALALASGWYPDAQTLEQARRETPGHDLQRPVLDAATLVAALGQALRARGLEAWRVEEDPVMSARVLVDGAKQLVRVSAQARFRPADVQRLVAHEIDVHATRSENGQRQPLRLFATGLPGSEETEEGLALLAEERAGVPSPGTTWRQGVVVQAVHWARELGFRALYERVADIAGPGLAWGVCERLKRGLADPERPGVYAKDIVYFRGIFRVRRYLEEGRELAPLFVGKVGLEDPVREWLDLGLITPQPVPALFAAPRVGVE